MTEYNGHLLTDTGAGVSGATVNAYAVGTTTPSVANDTTDATGHWNLSISGTDVHDIKIVNGSDVVWLLGSDKFGVSQMQITESTANQAGLTVTRTEDAASVEVAVFEGNRATPADGDTAYIQLNLSDDGGNQDEQARISWTATTVADGATQDGDLEFAALTNGSLVTYLRIDGSNGYVNLLSGAILTDNQTLAFGGDSDATILYDGTNLIVEPDAVGSGDMAIGAKLTVNNTSILEGTVHAHTASAGTVVASTSADEIVAENSGSGGISILTPNSNEGALYFGDPDDNDVGGLAYDHSTDLLQFRVNGANNVGINSSAHLGVGTLSPDGTIHAFSATAGSVTAAANADDLIVENSTDGGISILTPNNAQGSVHFGDPDDNDVGQLTYDHNLGLMYVLTETAVRGYFDEKGLTMRQSTANLNRSTTDPTNAIRLVNGTAPSGTLSNGIDLYSASGELRVMDAAGNSTLLSPHNDAGDWVYDSDSPLTGKHLHIEMEKLMKAINDHFGWNFVHETDL